MLPTLFVVDDDEIDRKIIERAVKRSGVALDTMFFSMSEAMIDHLAAPGAAPPQAIFIDLNMPRKDGLEVVADLQAAHPEIVGDAEIYIVTSSINPQDIERAEANPNVSGYVEKPVRKTDIAALFGGLGGQLA